MKVLIIRFSSIGDIVLTTPVIRALRLQLHAEVHFLTKPAFASILEVNPHISKVIRLASDIQETISVLQAENYDFIVDLHHNLRSLRIKQALKKPSKSFSKLNIEKWLLVRFGINRLPKVHIVDRYMQAASSLGIRLDGKGLDFYIPDSSKVEVASAFGFEPGSYVSIVIGAAHQTKCLTEHQIAELCDEINRPIVLLGGKEEIPKAEWILANTNNKAVKSAVGQFDLLQSASIIAQSGPIITHDTGMMHIAAARRKPQIVIWGNTIPGFGMYPYYGDESIPWYSFEIIGLRCRPCSKIGFDQCPKDHFKCILEQDIESITAQVKKMW